MAIKDLYKNRLQTGTKNLQSPRTIDDFNTNKVSLADGGSGAYEKMNLKNENSVNNSTWRDYADLINAKTTNSKMELQTAMQRAQSASNDYLKALGLQGSGVGQSQLTDMASNYQNALSSINRQAQSDVDTQLDSDFKSMVASGDYSPRQLQNYINQYGSQTGKSNEWQSYASTMGATIGAQTKNAITDLDSMINDEIYVDVNGRSLVLNDTQKNIAKSIQTQLIRAKTDEEKEKILDKYSNFLNDPETSIVEENTSESTNTAKRAIGNVQQVGLLQRRMLGFKKGQEFMIDNEKYIYLGDGKYQKIA